MLCVLRIPVTPAAVWSSRTSVPLSRHCMLLRIQLGRSVDISNSFEILYSVVDGKVVFDDAFMAKRLDQCEPQH